MLCRGETDKASLSVSDDFNSLPQSRIRSGYQGSPRIQIFIRINHEQGRVPDSPNFGRYFVLSKFLFADIPRRPADHGAEVVIRVHDYVKILINLGLENSAGRTQEIPESPRPGQAHEIPAGLHP